MTADQIIEAMRRAEISCDEDAIRKGWSLNQSQATDKYMALDFIGRQSVAAKAIRHVECMFCGARPGTPCSVVPGTSKVLDGFAHCGRWMEYLIDEDVFELLGPVRLEIAEVRGPAAALIDDNDISDML